MKNIKLNNGVEMPLVGLGTCGINGNAGVEIIKQAIADGYRLIDTARMYGNEEIVGEAISQCGINREKLFITTKLCKSSNSYEKAKADIDDSLAKLKIDYVDLLLVHEPYVESYEMYQAIKEAYQEGKARAIGISNFNKKCYLEFIEKCEIIPAVNQMESHVYFTQFDLKEEMEKHGTIMQAWSPLANGQKNIFKEEILVSLGKQYHKSSAQIALRYLIQNNVAIIPKTMNKNRLMENINVFDFELSKDDIQAIRKLDENKSFTNWYRSDWF